MSGQSSSTYGETDTAPASSSIRWAPHGRAMTACLVAVNVALVALVYLYFWRVFSRKRAASASSSGGDDEEDRASSSASAPPSPGRAQDDEQQQRRHDRLVASLPAFVARPGAMRLLCAQWSVPTRRRSEETHAHPTAQPFDGLQDSRTARTDESSIRIVITVCK